MADKRELLENTPSDAYWHLPGDACGTGCSKNCWALEACTHDITLWLPPEFRSDYEVKKAVYEVTDVKKNGAVLKNIKIEIETNDKPAETK